MVIKGGSIIQCLYSLIDDFPFVGKVVNALCARSRLMKSIFIGRAFLD